MYYGLAWRGRSLIVVCGSLRVALWDVGVGYGIRRPNWWSVVSGSAWMGSFSGVLCVRVLGKLVGVCGHSFVYDLPSLPDFYIILMNFYSVETHTNPAPKPRNSVNNSICLCKGHLADHDELQKKPIVFLKALIHDPVFDIFMSYRSKCS